MGKNKNKKKKGVGRIIKLFRNYGYISTDSFGQEGEELPFQFTPEMIKEIDGIEYIEYSKEAEFNIKKGVSLRDKIIREASDLKFDSRNLIKEKRVESKSYLEQVKEKFDLFNIQLPTKNQMENEIRELDLVVDQFTASVLKNFYDSVLVDDEAILYEYLTKIGFQPYMLDYIVNGLFIEKTLGNLKKIDVKHIVKIDDIDKVFREKILRWILGIENSYKSLLSRLATQREGGDEIAARVVRHWKNSTDDVKERQYKRAQNSYKYLSYSDKFDYINSDIIPLEDLMDQMDLSTLESLLDKFDVFSKESISTGGRLLTPFVRDIVLHKTVLSDLRIIRNAAAHGRFVIPTIVNPDYNPNWDLEFDNPLERTKIKDWFIFGYLKQVLISQGFDESMSVGIAQTIFGNPYRKAWFELNFIYHRFISLFDEKMYNDFKNESNYFLDYDSDYDRNEQEKNVNPILKDIGDLTKFESDSLLQYFPPAYKTIANEASLAEKTASLHFYETGIHLQKYS